MNIARIPFNRPYIVGNELAYITKAIENIHLSGDGEFTEKSQRWLEEWAGCSKALIVHSGTTALEMSAILADIVPGDEIIMPSFTFVSTANAFVMRGGVPVFVDIREDTLNIDESLIEEAITDRTRVIVPVHYAGVACEMDSIMRIADAHRLLVIEDAAHAVMARYGGKPMGSFGHLAAVSFHETKNIISGEGGALLINDARFDERADIIREKGTDRSRFNRGLVDKYTWVDIGSSYLSSEIIAAFLWAQMEQAAAITARRLQIWNMYHEALSDLEKRGLLRRPIVPAQCEHNAHMYYLLLADPGSRGAFITALNSRMINATFHYIPLHSSPGGMKYGRAHGEMHRTDRLSGSLVRLPLWVGLEEHIQDVIEGVYDFFGLKT